MGDQFPVPASLEDLRTGESWERAMRPFVLGYGDLAAFSVEHRSPTGPRACVYRHHVLGHSCHLKVSGFTTVSRGSPLRYRSTCLATMTAPLVVVSKVAPPMCGITMVLSSST